MFEYFLESHTESNFQLSFFQVKTKIRNSIDRFSISSFQRLVINKPEILTIVSDKKFVVIIDLIDSFVMFSYLPPYVTCKINRFNRTIQYE